MLWLQLFFSGAVACLLYLAIGWFLLLRTLRNGTAAGPKVKNLAKTLGAPDGIRIIINRKMDRPFCFGMRRMHIVLPATLVDSQAVSTLEAVLRHEIAHLAQGHTKNRLLVALTTPVLYWNPLFWWVAREMRCSSEMLADDMAVSGIGKRRYVEEFLTLAEYTKNKPSFWATGPAAFGSRREFLERMETLMKRKENLAMKTTTRHSITRLSTAAAFVVLSSLAWGQIQQQSEQGVDKNGDAPNTEPISGEIQLPELSTEASPQGGHFPTLQPRTSDVPGETQDNQESYTHLAQSFELNPSAHPHSTVYLPGTFAIEAELIIAREGALGEFLLRCIDANFLVEWVKKSPGLSNPAGGTKSVAIRMSRNVLPGEKTSTGLSLITDITKDMVGINVIVIKGDNKSPKVYAQNIQLKRTNESSELAALRKEVAQLRQSQRELTESMQALAAAMNHHSLADDRNQLISTAKQSTATVLRVLEKDGRNLIVLNRGTSTGYKQGMECYVYSGNTFKGTMTITEVDNTKCAGFITHSVPGKSVKVGDAASYRL